MKNKHSFTPPHKITALFLSGVLVLSCSSCSGAQSSSASEIQQQTEVSHSSVGSQEDLSATEQNLTSVSSGSVYNSVTSLDQNLTLQESDSCLYVTMDIPSGEFNANTRRFFWDLVRVIQMPDIWNSYTSMSFTFMSGDDMANVGISGYNNIYSFNATHINIMQDQDKNSIFDQFYMAVLGARDLSVAQDKSLYEMAEKYGTSGYSLPEDYRSGYFWVMSSFPYNAGYSVNDTAISVQVSAENTKQCGAQSAQELAAAVDIFNQLCNNDPLSMPYTKISVQYLDSNNSKLWDWCSEKSGDAWSVTQNSSNSVTFADGIHSTAK